MYQILIISIMERKLDIDDRESMATLYSKLRVSFWGISEHKMLTHYQFSTWGLTSKHLQVGPVCADAAPHLVGGGAAVLSVVGEHEVGDGQGVVGQSASLVLGGGLGGNVHVVSVDEPLPQYRRDGWGSGHWALNRHILSVRLLVGYHW